MKAASHLLISLVLILSINAFAQNVAINADGTAPDGSAMLDVKSSDKGFLPPRVWRPSVNISSPTAGLMVYQDDGSSDGPTGFYYYDVNSWKRLDDVWTKYDNGIYYNSGNVGIGTAAPYGKLDVRGGVITQTTTDFSLNSAGTAIGFSLGSQTGDTYGQITVGTAGDNTYGNLALLPGGGNVGIGTASPSALLTLKASSNTDALRIVQNNTADYGFSLQDDSNNGYLKLNRWAGGSTTGTLVTVATDGRVGIGTTTPAYPLHVASSAGTGTDPGMYFNASTSVLTSATQAWALGIYSYYSILTNGSFVAFSDLRIKENIKEIPHSLDLVRKLRPVSYNKIDKIENGGRTEFGFIAQEVEEILPEAVNTGAGEIPVLKPFDKVEFEEGVSYTILVKNGDNIVEQKYTTKDPRPEGEIIVKSKTVDDFKSLSYDMIFTVAVDAIREQQTQIEAQQAQIDALKAQNVALSQKTEAIDQLKAELENLKKLVHSNLSQLTINQ